MLQLVQSERIRDSFELVILSHHVNFNTPYLNLVDETYTLGVLHLQFHSLTPLLPIDQGINILQHTIVKLNVRNVFSEPKLSKLFFAKLTVLLSRGSSYSTPPHKQA